MLREEEELNNDPRNGMVGIDLSGVGRVDGPSVLRRNEALAVTFENV